MICLQTTDKVEAKTFEHYKRMLEVGHIPQWLVDHMTAYVRAYKMKHNDELPSFIDVIHGDSDE